MANIIYDLIEAQDCGEERNAVEVVQSLGLKIIAGHPETMIDAWFFTVEDFEISLPPYIVVREGRMSNGREYGGWDEMVKVFGPIHARYKRIAGKPETLAGFNAEGVQITEYCDHDQLLIEKAELLPWAKEKMEVAKGMRK